MIPIVDTHQHLWDLTQFNLPWVADVPLFNQSYVTEDYLAATDGANVTKALYMEVDVEASQHVAEALFLIDLCQRDDNPTVGAVISGRPAQADFSDYIQQFKDSPYIKGIRQVLHGPETGVGYCLQDAFVQGIQLLAQMSMSFDICIRPGELADAARLADLCPDTQFILDHCGNADPTIISATESPAKDESNPFWHGKEQWLDDIAALAERPNVVCKISGIVARAPHLWTADDLAPTINHCLNSFGPDRVIFGGDWPVCTINATYDAWVTALREIIADRSEEEQWKLLHDNAVKLYGLM